MSEPTQDIKAYRAQVVSDILDAKQKESWRPLIMVEWKPHTQQVARWWTTPRTEVIKGLPAGYVILSEPTCRQVELYGVLKRTIPAAAADQIVPRHVVVDRIGLSTHPRAGVLHTLMDVLTRWSSNDPQVLNPMLEHERVSSSPLSDFILSHIYSIDPSFPEANLAQLPYSQLLHKLYAVERTLAVATGGKAQPFRLVTPEMLREEQRLTEKAKLDKIFQNAMEEEEPPPPPPTLEEMKEQEMLRRNQAIVSAPPPPGGECIRRKREFR